MLAIPEHLLIILFDYPSPTNTQPLQNETDTVWLSDFGANAILSFDPGSETFTAYPSDRAGAKVRQILGRPSDVWAPEPGTDRLVVIRTTGE